MKKKMFITFVMIILLSSPTTLVKAHPGRTDSNGCHTCRTNCDKWGLSTGEYHCHNGGETTENQTNLISDDNTQPQVQKGTTEIPRNQVETPKIDYVEEGENDGYKFKKKYPNKELQEVEYTYENDDYKEAFNASFQKAEEELKDNTIQLASERGKQDALKTEAYQLEKLPSNIIEKVYTQYYKENYDEKEQEYYSEIETQAKNNAYAKIYNEKDNNQETYDLEKFKQHYNEAYEKYITQYKEEKNGLLETAVKKGEEDGKAGEKGDYSFLDKFKDTKFYQEAKDVYQKNYDENKSNDNVFVGIAFIAIIVVVIIGVIAKVRKKK